MIDTEMGHVADFTSVIYKGMKKRVEFCLCSATCMMAGSQNDLVIALGMIVQNKDHEDHSRTSISQIHHYANPRLVAQLIA